MFLGKRPTDNMFKDGLNLHNFAKMALPEKLVQIVDPILLPREVDEAPIAIVATRDLYITKSWSVAFIAAELLLH